MFTSSELFECGPRLRSVVTPCMPEVYEYRILITMSNNSLQFGRRYSLDFSMLLSLLLCEYDEVMLLADDSHKVWYDRNRYDYHADQAYYRYSN